MTNTLVRKFCFCFWWAVNWIFCGIDIFQYIHWNTNFNFIVEKNYSNIWISIFKLTLAVRTPGIGKCVFFLILVRSQQQSQCWILWIWIAKYHNSRGRWNPPGQFGMASVFWCNRRPAILLQWRHNGHNSVSNHQPHDCFLKRLFRHRSKKTSKLRVTGLCTRNSPEGGEVPAQMASNAENVSIWWRHHVTLHREINWRVTAFKKGYRKKKSETFVFSR